MFINSLEYRITLALQNYATRYAASAKIFYPLDVIGVAPKGYESLESLIPLDCATLKFTVRTDELLFSSQWKFYFNFILMKMRARDTMAAY